MALSESSDFDSDLNQNLIPNQDLKLEGRGLIYQNTYRRLYDYHCNRSYLSIDYHYINYSYYKAYEMTTDRINTTNMMMSIT